MQLKEEGGEEMEILGRPMTLLAENMTTFLEKKESYISIMPKRGLNSLWSA